MPELVPVDLEGLVAEDSIVAELGGGVLAEVDKPAGIDGR